MSEPGTSPRAALHREGMGQRLYTDEGERRGGGATQDASLPAQWGSDVSIRVGTQNRSLTLASGGRGCDVIFTGLHWRVGGMDSSGHSSDHSGRVITSVTKWVMSQSPRWTKEGQGGRRVRAGHNPAGGSAVSMLAPSPVGTETSEPCLELQTQNTHQ